MQFKYSRMNEDGVKARTIDVPVIPVITGAIIFLAVGYSVGRFQSRSG